MVLSRQPTAEDAARSYLTALSQGDLDTIQTMRDQRLDEDAELILATAFADAAYVEDPKIDDIGEGSGGVLAVRATAEIESERVDVSFDLVRGDDGDWALRGDYLGSATVEAHIEEGTALPAVWIGDALASSGAESALLPARYVATAAPRGVVEGEAELHVAAGDSTAVELTATLTPEATVRAQEQIDAYAQGCAVPATTVPDNCGLVVPWAADLADLERIAFRIEQLPTVGLSPGSASFDATGGSIVATATGVTHEGTPASFTYRADDWSLRGTLELSGEEMLLAVR